ncbi:MAG TPA: helix-turn-helix transcriptional regulator [Methylomusa anaerophila]|uniref:Anaerobic benzoate catabolism transcriptional regulator n=1 Tax=Methylomusa anaerophila TaxID=1930071 RepID=A0A348AK57_9FIRM|nr:helix-turn-helix transcriptional regulator [Methylomusa anaerophila]BBB91455.1 anaerobic benzoate catabolism transcriptional regulator [Methylomusa anaerophila]HML89955.1 helix-turn-helix transcriptional regulator [Methylomusa anaerophila]
MRKKDTDKFFPIYKEVGRRIAFFRNLRGLSQEELAAKVDISASHLSKIEAPNIQISFSLDMLLLIAEGLDVPVAALFAPVEAISIQFKNQFPNSDM